MGEEQEQVFEKLSSWIPDLIVNYILFLPLINFLHIVLETKLWLMHVMATSQCAHYFPLFSV